MKKFILPFALGFCLLAIAATDKFIHQLPSRGVTGVELIPSDVETAPGVWANYKLLVSDIRGSATNVVPEVHITVVNATTNIVLQEFVFNFISTNVTVYSNAYFYSTNFVNYEFVTNLTVTYLTVQSNAYFYETNFNNYEITTNLTVVNNFQVQSNAYFYETNFVNYEYTTNLTVQEFTILSNAYFFETNAYITNLFVDRLIANTSITTNINYYNAAPFDVAWSGPTNYLSYTNGSLQSYATLTPVSVSSVINEVSGVGNTVLLCVTNASSTNITIYLPTAYKVAAGNTVPLTLTNANIGEVWFYSAGNRKTVIYQQFATPP